MRGRMGRVPYLGLWAVLAAVQVLGALQLIEDAPWAAAGLVLALQLPKVPLAARRLQDLGQPPDDALLALVPLANLNLWTRLLEATPTAEVHEKRVARWEGDVGALGVLWKGAGVIGRAFPLALGLAAAVTALGTWLQLQAIEAIEALLAGPPETLELVSQMSLALVVVLALYGVLQIPKRHTASRLSWTPVLLLLPTLLFTLGIWILRDPHTEVPLAIGITSVAFGLLWQCFAGAALAVVWVTLADLVHRGAWPGLGAAAGEALGAMASRWLQVAAPYGARVQIVTVGMQVVIPGIHYMLVLALVEHAAVLKPDDNALSRSSQLTRGIRRRLFIVLYVPFLIWFGGALALQFARYPAENVMAALVYNDPRHFDFLTLWVPEVVGVLAFAAATAGLLWTYREREARLLEREADRAEPQQGDVMEPQDA